jgi:hypothetical protein
MGTLTAQADAAMGGTTLAALIGPGRSEKESIASSDVMRTSDENASSSKSDASRKLPQAVRYNCTCSAWLKL